MEKWRKMDQNSERSIKDGKGNTDPTATSYLLSDTKAALKWLGWSEKGTPQLLFQMHMSNFPKALLPTILMPAAVIPNMQRCSRAFRRTQARSRKLVWLVAGCRYRPEPSTVWWAWAGLSEPSASLSGWRWYNHSAKNNTQSSLAHRNIWGAVDSSEAWI